MIAEVISIGDELLIGHTNNTNASWIGEQFNLIGIKVSQITTIQDNREQILSELKTSLKRSDIVVITGGLGPTNDDITKNALCEYFDSNLLLNENILENIQSYFLNHDLKMLDVNRDQALLPHNCKLLENKRGTASGMWFEKKGVIFISLPGVPFEMKGIMIDSVIPILKDRFVKGYIVHTTVKTHGIGESFLAEKIKDWEMRLGDEYIKLAYLPSPGIVKLRLTAFGKDEKKLLKKIEVSVEELKLLIPDYIFGYDQDDMEHVVGDLLRKNNKTLSIAESCTGGYLAQLITSVSGCSDYFKGSVVAYANEIKKKVLNVDSNDLDTYGAVSKQVVEQMAKGIREQFNTDFGVATSGIAGPGGGTKEKPVGTVWIAVACKDKVISNKFMFGRNRKRNIKVGAISALNMLRVKLS